MESIRPEKVETERDAKYRERRKTFSRCRNLCKREVKRTSGLKAMCMRRCWKKKKHEGNCGCAKCISNSGWCQGLIDRGFIVPESRYQEYTEDVLEREERSWRQSEQERKQEKKKVTREKIQLKMIKVLKERG